MPDCSHSRAAVATAARFDASRPSHPETCLAAAEPRRRAGMPLATLLVAIATASLGAALPLGAQPIPEVEARALAELLIEAPAQAPASVQSLNAATLSAEVTAVILAFPAADQASVDSGETLVVLDDTDHRLALRQAEATLAAAQARVDLVQGRLERARRLIDDGFVSVDDVAALETELAVALADTRVQEAARAVAQRALDKTRVRAPFDGQTGNRLAAVGQLAMPGTPLLAMTDLERIELVAAVAAADADSLQGGAELRFAVLDAEHRVELLRLSRVVDAGTRTREARLRFLSDPPPIGSQGRLLWQRPGGILPSRLLVRRDGRLGLFLVDGDRARFHHLPHAQEGRPASVDLPPGTLVVDEGRDALNDGDPVRLR